MWKKKHTSWCNNSVGEGKQQRGFLLKVAQGKWGGGVVMHILLALKASVYTTETIRRCNNERETKKNTFSCFGTIVNRLQ